MENIIEIKDLTFSYKDNIIFENLNLEIKNNSFTTIIGPNNSGKTTLCKIILGLIKSNSSIKIDKKFIEFVDKETIAFIPNNIDDTILMDTVIDEIKLNNKVSEEVIDGYLKEYNLLDKKYKNPNNLSCGEKQLMYLISILIKHPRIIICDDAFSNLDIITKDKILKKLKEISKNEKITIVNFTNDTEDIIYGNYVAILNNHKIILNDKLNKFYDEKIFKSNNLKVPFIIDLSLKLKYYNLLDNVELDMNRMINRLWN